MKVKIYSTPEDTADELAFELVLKINRILESQTTCSVALSGGKTPRLLFKFIADNLASSVNWDKVHFFWVDERCVPPDDSESNYGMTMKALLTRIKISPSNIHRIQGEDDPDKEALRYSGVLLESVPEKNSFPFIDIVLLGMGEDGHTASIFPGNEDAFLSDRTCIVTIHPATRQKRITLTGKVINNAGEVIVFATGSNKSEIIGKVMGKNRNKIFLPIAFVNPSSGRLTWFLDDEAASKIKKQFPKD